MQAEIAISVIDGALRLSQHMAMCDHDELRDELIRRLDTKELKPSAVADALRIDRSRVSEIRKRKRRVQPNEMAPLAELLNLSQPAAPSDLPSASDFAELLRTLGPLASASLDSEEALQVLGEIFRGGVADRMDDPARSIDRAIGALEERLKNRDIGPAAKLI